MKIGVFAYNFKHKKTYEGLNALFLAGIKIDCILAADPVPLNFYQSKIRVSPKGLDYLHPKKIAEKLGIEYVVVDHNSPEACNLVKTRELDLGIILGARILKQPIISSFKTGIINMHPGLLPKNRGLDNLKWAIINGFKQGVTTHLIDTKIDRGLLIDQKTIDVFEDDTLLDIFLRIQNLETQMMIEAVHKMNCPSNLAVLGEGQYFKSVPPELETNLHNIFEKYKKTYANLS